MPTSQNPEPCGEKLLPVDCKGYPYLVPYEDCEGQLLKDFLPFLQQVLPLTPSNGIELPTKRIDGGEYEDG